jgi:hypothetical protein
MEKGNTKGARWVYNFVFPQGCQQLTVYGYVFKRVEEYKDRVQSLQHLISSCREFDQPENTGTHAITAHLDLPSKEKKPVIEWGNKKANALDDILLLLSIFTHRDVFAIPEPIEKGKGAITCDSREYVFGLRTAIQYEKGEDEHGDQCNVGFQKDIEHVYNKMRTTSWQKEYGRGRFLLLFQSACKRQILEISFITCWTIWEILFTLHNQSWLSDGQIIKLPASEKISFVLTRYQIMEQLDMKDRKGIQRFVKIRNGLVHAGRFVDKDAIHDATLFVRGTAIIVAQILGLSLSDVHGSQAQLLTRLRG